MIFCSDFTKCKKKKKKKLSLTQDHYHKSALMSHLTGKNTHTMRSEFKKGDKARMSEICQLTDLEESSIVTV